MIFIGRQFCSVLEDAMRLHLQPDFVKTLATSSLSSSSAHPPSLCHNTSTCHMLAVLAWLFCTVGNARLGAQYLLHSRLLCYLCRVLCHSRCLHPSPRHPKPHSLLAKSHSLIKLHEVVELPVFVGVWGNGARADIEGF